MQPGAPVCWCETRSRLCDRINGSPSSRLRHSRPSLQLCCFTLDKACHYAHCLGDLAGQQPCQPSLVFPFSLSSSRVCCRDPEEFTLKLEHALSHDPQPMTPDQRKRLTWEDATERFLDIAELKADERPGVLEAAVDKLAWAAHNTLTGGQQNSAFWGPERGCWVTSVGLACRFACLGGPLHAGNQDSSWQIFAVEAFWV